MKPEIFNFIQFVLRKVLNYWPPPAGTPGCAFSGAEPAGAAFGSAPTFPLIRTTFTGSFAAFELIVTDLLIGPGRLVSYLTVMIEL